MPAAERMSRRLFLRQAGAFGAAAMGFPYIVGQSAVGGTTSPSSRITVGFIGVGMQGRGLLWEFLHEGDCRAVCVCDVDQRKGQRARAMVDEYYAGRSAGGMGSGCDYSGDFRRVLARNDIDAVVIAAPDHWHSSIAIEACRAGKDVYCEKPLSVTIGEARQMVNAARRYGRVVQTGSMQRSDARFRHACELVRNGFIGDIKTVTVNITVAGFPMTSVECDLGGEAVPDYLDWEMWLGPAPLRPYNSRLAPPAEVDAWPHWRDYRDYSGGMMTDWGAHHFDIAQWGLGTDTSGPIEVIPPDGKDYPMLTYKYANGVLLQRDDTRRDKAVVFSGTQGVVDVSRNHIRTQPSTLARQQIGANEIHLYKSENHYANWLNCIRTRSKPVCDVEIGCRSATVCHIGNIAHRLGRAVKWDPAKEQFVNDLEADRFLLRGMRGCRHL